MTPSEIVNLTPHEVVVYASDGATVTQRYGPSGRVARVLTTARPDLSLDGVEVWVTSTTEVADLPLASPGVFLLVSALVAVQHEVLGRHDVVVPDTGPDSVVRDQRGVIHGVRRLTRYTADG